MNPRTVSLALFLLLACGFAAAADLACANGNGQFQKPLWEGYTVAVVPAETQPGQCHAAITSADGRVVFDATAPSARLDPISGRDVNGDGKPDVVLETRHAGEQCCFTYSIITPGASPALVREITTSVPLTFEDKIGDGKIEISGREKAFQDFDGLPLSLSPSPLLIFRLKGSTLYYVSPAYWDEYEREVAEVRAQLSQKRIDKFMGNEPGAKPHDKPKELSPEEVRMNSETKSMILQMVLAYLYGGKGQEAWKTLQETWPYADRDRVRQLILQTRARGVMSEVNRQAPKAGAPQP